MVRRVIGVLILIALLATALIYSQVRTRSVSVSGFVEADDIRLGSRLGGRIGRVLVEEGDRVHAGDVLVELEPYDWNQRIEEAESLVQSRLAELGKLKKGNRPEEIAQAAARVDNLNAIYQKLLAGARPEEKMEAQSQLKLAEAQLARARRSRERFLQLLEQGSSSVSRDEYDRADEEFKVAEARYETQSVALALIEKGNRQEDIDAARANLEQATQALQLAKHGFRQEDIDAAQAGLASAQSQLSALKIQEKELLIKAPGDGVVSALDLRPGDLVAPNAPIVSLLDTQRIWIRAYVPENRLDIQLGNRFTVTLDSYPGKKFVGEVTYIASQAEFTPRNVQTPEERSKQVFRIKVRILDSLPLLHPGMAADIWLDQPIEALENTL